MDYKGLAVSEFLGILQMNILNKSVWKQHTFQNKARCILGNDLLKSSKEHICIIVDNGPP